MTIQRVAPEIFKKFHVKLAYLFGSRAKGTAAAESDYDVAVLFREKPADPLALKETAFLSLELKRGFAQRLEIVSLNDAPLLLQYEVTAHGQPLYCENEEERVRFEVLTIKKYIDEQPMRNVYNRALHERILRGNNGQS